MEYVKYYKDLNIDIEYLKMDYAVFLKINEYVTDD